MNLTTWVPKQTKFDKKKKEEEEEEGTYM